jgi:tellurite resistance protein TerC
MFPVWAWVAFGAFVLLMLVLDLFVLHRDAKEISFREAAVLSAFWVALALLFGILIWIWGDRRPQANTTPATSSRRRFRWTTSSSSP